MTCIDSPSRRRLSAKLVAGFAVTGLLVLGTGAARPRLSWSYANTASRASSSLNGPAAQAIAPGSEVEFVGSCVDVTRSPNRHLGFGDSGTDVNAILGRARKVVSGAGSGHVSSVFLSA